MADSGNVILSKILGVLDEMNKKISSTTTPTAGATPGTVPTSGKKTSTSTGSISSVLQELVGSKVDTKKASASIRDLTGALKDLSTVKFNVFNKLALKGTTESLKELVKFAIYVGNNEDKVKKGSDLIKDLSGSLSKMATALPKFLGYLALGMLGFVLSLVIIGKIILTSPGQVALGFAAIILTIVGIFWTVGKLKDKIEAGTGIIKDMSKSLVYLGGSMVLFAVAVALIPRILGVGMRAQNQSDNALTAAIGVGIIIGSVLLFSFAYFLLGKGKDKILEGTQVLKEMSLGIMYLAGGMVAFAIAVALIPRILGIQAGAKNQRDNTTTALYGIGAIALGIAGFAFAYIMIGKFGKEIKKGTNVVQDMGIGILVLSGAMIIFAMTVALVPRILGVQSGAKNQEKNKTTAVLGASLIIGTITAFAIGFGVLGAFEKVVKKGAIVAMFIGGAIAILSIGILIFATTAKAISAMGDSSASKTVKTVNADGTTTTSEKKRGKLGQLFAGIGPGLGAMGLIIVAAAGLFAVLGIPPVAALIGLGAAVAAGISLALIVMAKAIKNVAEVTKGISGAEISSSIAMAVSSVIIGVTQGVNEGFGGKGAKNVKINFKEFRQTKRAMRMLGSIAESISKFGEGLRAFEATGKIGKVTFEEVDTGQVDEDGQKIYRTKVSMNKNDAVNVTDVAANIGFALSVFVKSIADTMGDNSGKTKRQLRRLRKGLGGGDDGLMGPIASFAEIIRTFADMDKTGNIPVFNAEGNPVMIGTGKNAVPKTYNLTEAAINIAAGFGSFIDTFTSKLKPSTLYALQNTGINKIGDLAVALGDLASSQEGLDKLATSMGNLATSIGLLSVNLKALDTSNLAKLTITAGEYQKRYGTVSPSAPPPAASKTSTIKSETTAGTTETSTIKAETKFSEDEMRMLAQLIGDQIGTAFKNKPFQFKFASGETMSGVIQ